MEIQSKTIFALKQTYFLYAKYNFFIFFSWLGHDLRELLDVDNYSPFICESTLEYHVNSMAFE